MASPLKFTIRPEVKDWGIFARGCSSAGYGFSFLEDEPDKDYLQTLVDDYHYSISLPVPEYLSRSIPEFTPFVLHSEEIIFVFTLSPKQIQQVQVFSDSYHPKELTTVAEKVMRNLVQQYGFHRTLSILRPRDYFVAGESVMADASVKMTLRRWTLADKQMEEITVLSGPQKEEIRCDINALGFLTFDLTLLESENQERYYQLFITEIGPRVHRATLTPTLTRGALKTSIANTFSNRGR